MITVLSPRRPRQTEETDRSRLVRLGHGHVAWDSSRHVESIYDFRFLLHLVLLTFSHNWSHLMLKIWSFSFLVFRPISVSMSSFHYQLTIFASVSRMASTTILYALKSKTKLRAVSSNPTGRGYFREGNVLDFPGYRVSSCLPHDIQIQKRAIDKEWWS